MHVNSSPFVCASPKVHSASAAFVRYGRDATKSREYQRLKQYWSDARCPGIKRAQGFCNPPDRKC